ncbi:MAG: DUF507 family protein [Nitrospinae bacterium]|nr:DUF507 family protein [Nitrospinota bacterium]MCY4381902.1 DUF507 family protein [Nitrospinota bacterium]
MKLSREKINHLTNLVVKDIEECEDVDFLVEPQELRMNVLRAISNELIIDDEIEEEVRRILSTYSSRLVEGSRDWEILFNKHYDQEAKRRGI